MHHIFYHANCADGFAAACIARQALIGRGEHPDTLRFHPVNYQDRNQLPVGDDHLQAYDQLTWLDYTPAQDVIDTILLAEGGTLKLTIIDHHEKAAPLHGFTKHPEHGVWHRATRPPFESIFRFTQSGAGLAWSHFYPDVPPPLAVRLIEHRDLGHAFQQPDHAYSNEALELHAYLFRCLPRTFDAWSHVVCGCSYDRTGHATKIGARLRAADGCIIGAAVYACHWLDFSGLGLSAFCPSPSALARIPAVNGLDAGLISDACQALLKAYPTAPFAASWYICPTTGKAVYSLRSRAQNHPDGHVNVSHIASACAEGGGGGGHPCAAGFSTTTPIPFAA